MPKRTVKQNNTLLNYFQSPKEKVSSPNLNKQKENTQPESDDDDDNNVGIKRKRNLSLTTSDSDNQRLESPGPSSTSSKRKKFILKDSDESDKNPVESTKTSTIKRKRLSETRNVDDIDSNPKSLKAFSFSNEKSTGTIKTDNGNESQHKVQGTVGGTSGDDNWEHNHMKFLQPKFIKDSNKRLSDHLDYDNKTLYVPEDFLNKQTPAMRQWWILKSQHYDSVLFFKVGKFYELYHMDAVIGVNHLGFSYMKGSFAHSGFPESAYGRMASSLVDQGFKVARIEQTETTEMMAERCKSSKLKTTKYDKVVKREICQITTKATCVYGPQLQEAKRSSSSYMIAITEKSIPSGTRFGVCFVDTSIGVFNMTEFDDDKYYSLLLALMAQHPPELILTERGCIQADTLDFLKKTFINIRRDILAPKSQFYDAQTTLDVLMSECYFLNKEEEFQWPSVLKDLVENGCPKPGYEMTLKSLGACIWYLKDSLIDIQVLSLKKFTIYEPINIATKSIATSTYMVLDSVTLGHLELLGDEGSLQKTIDFCVTPFGKRLLQQWICRPLCVQRNIELRQEAVQELVRNDQMRSSARAILKNLPDLERLINKINTFGNRFIAKQHPDSRAIFYEAPTYSANKVRDLLNTLRAFEITIQLVRIFADCESQILKGLTNYPPLGKFSDLTPTLRYFKDSFNQHEAEIQFKIIPEEGMDEEYDQSLEAITNLESQIEEYRCEQEKFFGCKIVYHGTGKNRYQLEIPEYKCAKVTTDYKLEGRKKGTQTVRRYSTSVTSKFVADMIKAETRRNNILQDLNRRIFEKFSDRAEEWEQVVQCLTMLDVLCSFAEYTKNSRHSMCFPKILPFSDEPFIGIEHGIYPCTKLEDFVPNSTYLGTQDHSKIMILTGPNMGGKSTLMKQVALIMIMAQMGCSVPATNCELTLVDRIFTRIGAQDDILHGNSTFMLELTEAATILRHATTHSFVLIDELGRGTSTHDGNAIASAYLNKLISLQCRTIFSSHYHSLVERFSNRDDIQLGHMACLSDDNDEDSDSPKISVTLLYQLQKGNCPESYGFNAAKLAGLPNHIIQNAHKVARMFETLALHRSYMRRIVHADIHDIRTVLKDLSKLKT